MVKTQSLNYTERNTIIFFVAATVIIITAFLLFTPKVASKLFPFKRQAIYSQFINTVKNDNSINPQGYWEFREFYSPGYFTMNKTGLPKDEVSKALDSIGIPLKESAIRIPFAIFHSPMLTSIDGLSDKSNLSQILDINPQNVIFRNNSSLIYHDGAKTVKIVFIKPETEMKKAVGFFEYDQGDKEITNGKHWLNITAITLD